MKNAFFILILVSFFLSCSGKKKANANDTNSNGIENIIADSVQPDSLHHPLSDEFMNSHMPPPPPPDGMHPGGPPPPPPHCKGRPPHKPDNMRGFDPASEDDMDDNGMSRYMEKRVNSESRAMLA